MRELIARILCVGMPVGLALLGSTPSLAQYGSGTTQLNAGQRALKETAGQGKGQVAPPPVLPGTKTAPEAAAPTASPSDMSPTEALFDSINRGDVAAAREAMNRGADPQARNVLGLTPLELSVDLGRNDISFVLLSMRDTDSNRSPSHTTDADGAILRGGTATQVRRTHITTVSARAPAEPIAEAPRLYSGNGGTPIPAAGFLGFNGR